MSISSQPSTTLTATGAQIPPSAPILVSLRPLPPCWRRRPPHWALPPLRWRARRPWRIGFGSPIVGVNAPLSFLGGIHGTYTGLGRRILLAMTGPATGFVSASPPPCGCCWPLVGCHYRPLRLRLHSIVVALAVSVLAPTGKPPNIAMCHPQVSTNPGACKAVSLP